MLLGDDLDAAVPVGVFFGELRSEVVVALAKVSSAEGAADNRAGKLLVLEAESGRAGCGVSWPIGSENGTTVAKLMAGGVVEFVGSVESREAARKK